MFTGIEVPLEVALAIWALCVGVGAMAGRWHTLRRPVPSRSPLDELLNPATLGPAIDLASRRNAMREASYAVLHGRIDHLAGLRGIWNPDLRDQVRGQVADIMRAGLRRGDSFSETDGNSFTIVIPGADERTATRIADRLRRSLAQLRRTNPGTASGLSASFGVAAGRRDDDGGLLTMRARRALAAAIARGEGHVVAASDIEEVIYLPAPAPSPAASAA